MFKFVYEFMFLIYLVTDHIIGFVISFNIHDLFGLSLEQ